MIESIKSMSTITLTVLVMIVVISMLVFLVLYPIIFLSATLIMLLTVLSYFIANSIKDVIRIRKK